MTPEIRTPIWAYLLAALITPLWLLVLWTAPAFVLRWFGTMLAGDGFGFPIWQLVLALSCLPDAWRKQSESSSPMTFRAVFLSAIGGGLLGDLCGMFAGSGAYPFGTFTVLAPACVGLGSHIADIPKLASDLGKVWRHWKSRKA